MQFIPFATSKKDLEHLLDCLQGTQNLQVELHYSTQKIEVKK